MSYTEYANVHATRMQQITDMDGVFVVGLFVVVTVRYWRHCIYLAVSQFENRQG